MWGSKAADHKNLIPGRKLHGPLPFTKRVIVFARRNDEAISILSCCLVFTKDLSVDGDQSNLLQNHKLLSSVSDRFPRDLGIAMTRAMWGAKAADHENLIPGRKLHGPLPDFYKILVFARRNDEAIPVISFGWLHPLLQSLCPSILQFLRIKYPGIQIASPDTSGEAMTRAMWGAKAADHENLIPGRKLHGPLPDFYKILVFARRNDEAIPVISFGWLHPLLQSLCPSILQFLRIKYPGIQIASPDTSGEAMTRTMWGAKAADHENLIPGRKLHGPLPDFYNILVIARRNDEAISVIPVGWLHPLRQSLCPSVLQSLSIRYPGIQIASPDTSGSQ
ncbi:hypothetical protein [Maribellus luteus]|nr:hypothetical protein [Maribellus luteus]